MGSSGGSDYEQSPETRALTAQQTEILKNINATVSQLDPATFSLLGMKQATTQVVNPAWESWSKQSGRYKNRTAEPEQYITKTSWVPMTEEEKASNLQGTDKQMYDLQQLQYQRLLDAYNGTDAVSPSLEADLTKQRETLEETMAQKLGANWAQSTPGIQAIGEFNKQAGLLREEARRSEINSGQGLLLNNLSYQQGSSQNKLSNLVNVPSQRYQGSLSSGESLLNTLTQQDANTNNYSSSNQQVSKGATAASGALTGLTIGASIGGPWGAAAGAGVGLIGGLLAG